PPGPAPIRLSRPAACGTGFWSSPILLSQSPSTCSPVSLPVEPQKTQVDMGNSFLRVIRIRSGSEVGPPGGGRRRSRCLIDYTAHRLAASHGDDSSGRRWIGVPGLDTRGTLSGALGSSWSVDGG